MGKILERIVKSRLEAHVESEDILDKEQEGFRHFCSTTNALLNFTQAITDGFNSDEMTLAVLIDFEKAYDSVWREGLLGKLNQYGIRGRMWLWIQAFLEDRYARCIVNNHEGDWFRTGIGLPQGSVISPLLFNIFVIDLFKGVKSGKCKFADDSTIWSSGKTTNEVAKQTQEDLNTISEWSKKWRININVDKTEYCIFSRSRIHPGRANLSFGNKQLKYNPNPKLLGVTLDERLTYSQHILSIEKKTAKSIGMLRGIKGIGNIKTKFLIQIYSSMIGSVLQYASCVWQTGSAEQLNKLNAIQRKGLSICLGVPSTASIDALEVMAGVLPLDLRRQEMAIRDVAKINSYSTKIPVKSKVTEWKNKETIDRHISPLGLMIQQADEMKKEAGIDINNIEPEFEFNGLQASKSPPDYWRNLGSSKKRTKEQEDIGKELIQNKLRTISSSAAVAFTDGSCLKNPGPCGAGAFVVINNREIELKQPVSKRGSILLAEIIAINLVLEYIDQQNNRNEIDELNIFSDSQTAIGVLSLNWKIENHHSTIRSVISKINSLQKNGVGVSFEWTPGHASINGNEIADKLAKEAAKEADEILDETHITITRQDVKTAAREIVMKKWQHRWDMSEKGRFYYNFHPKIEDKALHDFPNKKMGSIINQLRSGYCLNEYLHKISPAVNAECECGEQETIEHYLLHCERYEEARQKLINRIYFYTGSVVLDLDFLLSVKPKVNDTIISCHEIMSILGDFIEETRRFD